MSKKWKLRENYSATDMSQIVKELLDKRNLYANLEEPNIHFLTDAVDFAKECIRKGMPITIVGDYDCDGITSSSILKIGLTEYTTVIPEVIIPRRFTDGYGINKNIIERIPCGLVICVDNGISAVEPIAYAKEKGLSVIILDHHAKREDGIIPNADVVVDPSAEDEDVYKNYCGAGLAYRFIKQLNPQTELEESIMALAGVGTIADVMPLLGHNRVLVQKSLEYMRDRKVPFGLKILLDALDLNEYMTEQDIGFTLGPCFNAPGRLYDDGAKKMVDFITFDESLIISQADLDDFKKIAKEIIAINEERKLEAKKEIEIAREYFDENSKIAVIEDDTFKKGIVGIVAGDFTEKYGIPSLVGTIDPKNTDNIVGSGRSPENLNLKDTLDKVSDLLIGYGGHSGAAGFTVKKENFELLKERLEELLKDYTPLDTNTLYYDIEITDNMCDFLTLWQSLRKYAPFGEGNRDIVVKINGLSGMPFIMGNQKNHFKISGATLDAIGFHMADRWIAEGKPTAIDVIGELSLNCYKGIVKPQIKMLDFKKKEIERTETYNEFAQMFQF